METPKTVESQGVAKETKRLVERLGEKKVRAIAALGLAAATLIGSGKLNTGVGVGIEIPNPMTGEPTTVGVVASSTEEAYPLGIPNIPGKDYKDIESFQVRVGGAILNVYTASLEDTSGTNIRTIGIHPGFDTNLGGR